MRLMIFYDFENFKRAVFLRDPNRWLHIGLTQYFLVGFLSKVLKWNVTNESLVRSYSYTGKYTDSLFKKIERDLEDEKESEQKERLKYLLNETKRKSDAQVKFFKKCDGFNFFELKTFPLHYNKGHIFQKGIDVQLAVDLVSNAYLNNYDVAILCSGDVDLVSSIKLVKSLGKKVILVSHPRAVAVDMRKEADYFIDLSSLREEDLDEFSNKRDDKRGIESKSNLHQKPKK